MEEAVEEDYKYDATDSRTIKETNKDVEKAELNRKDRINQFQQKHAKTCTDEDHRHSNDNDEETYDSEEEVSAHKSEIEYTAFYRKDEIKSTFKHQREDIFGDLIINSKLN